MPGRHERAGERVTYRKGHRPRTLDTRLGRLELEPHKLRPGMFLPSLLEPRPRIEQALSAAIREVHPHGWCPPAMGLIKWRPWGAARRPRAR